MPNTKFAKHVRATAFSLQLSPRGISHLLAVYRRRQTLSAAARRAEPHREQFYIWGVGGVKYLHRRGLIKLHHLNVDGGYVTLTKAGRKLAELLLLAGYDVPEPSIRVPEGAYPDMSAHVYLEG